MSKYDKKKQALRLAKELTGATFSDVNNNTLKTYDKMRRFRNSRDRELYNFGIELYNNGYSLDDFKNSINACIECGFNSAEQIDATGWFTYEYIENIPSALKIITIIKNQDLILSVENGYNVAKRIAYAKKLDDKNDNNGKTR